MTETKTWQQHLSTQEITNSSTLNEDENHITETKTWQQHFGVVRDSVNGYHVIGCSSCGFTHIVPLPTEEELVHVYSGEALKDTSLSADRYRRELDWYNLVFDDRYDTFEAHLPAERRRILDVGCGLGFFLLRGKERGWDTVGIEPGERSAAYGRRLGLEIVADFLTKAVTDRLGKFDAIHMSEVLEHIPDPRGMLQLMHSLLRPGGLLCLMVPNDYNPFQRAFRLVSDEKPWWLAPPNHVNYFTLDSLTQILLSSGFEITLREASFPIDMFLLMGDNYIGNDTLGQKCHQKRKNFELSLQKAGMGDIRRRLYETLGAAGMGREIVIYARAKEKDAS